MAVTTAPFDSRTYIGLSTDTKPTAATHRVTIGSKFIEYDTGLVYITHDGTNWVVIDNSQGSQPLFAAFTGSAAISADTARIQPGQRFRLLRVEIHLDSAPASQAEDFTITLDAGDGSEYDAQLFKQDLYTTAVQDLAVEFGEGYEFEADDEIDIAWTNTPTETYGLRIVYELL